MFILAAVAALGLVADPKVPDLGFDYQSLVADHMAAVASGKADRAIGLLESRAAASLVFTAEAKEAMSRQIARVYGGAGKHLGSELVGFKRVTSRVVRVYAASHFEQHVASYVFTFVRGGDGAWKLSVYTMGEVDELERVAPVTPFPPQRD